MKKDKTDPHRTTLRLPPALFEELLAIAKYNGRSINAEIVSRLQAASVGDQFTKIFRELAEIKAVEREILEAVSNHRK
jgi:hypothetical protein